MKIFILTVFIGILPMCLFSQTVDLTISPDSLYFDFSYYRSTTLTNNSNQPINLVSVQHQCIWCGNWSWWVDSLSVTTPHMIYPGQCVFVYLQTAGGVFDGPLIEYEHSTMQVVSSVGTQFCHIFFNKQLISTIEDKITNDVGIYPNPSSSSITLRLTESAGSIKSIDIKNSLGRSVFSGKMNDFNYPINVELLPSGIYLARITTSTHIFVKKFLKN